LLEPTPWFVQEYQKLLEKAQRLMSIFTRSPKATAELVQAQEDAGVLIPLKAKVAGGVRWWRFEYLLERMIDLKEFVNGVIVDNADTILADSETWSPVDNKQGQKLLSQLKVVRSESAVLEADKHPTMNLVLPAIAKMQQQLGDSKEMKSTSFGKRFLHHLESNVQVRCVVQLRRASAYGCAHADRCRSGGGHHPGPALPQGQNPEHPEGHGGPGQVCSAPQDRTVRDRAGDEGRRRRQGHRHCYWRRSYQWRF
jgi:hypothetical protein